MDTASLVKAMLAGKLGRINFDINLYASDINGMVGEKLEGIEDTRISMSNYRDWTWEVSCSVTGETNFDPVRTYVRAFAEIEATSAGKHSFPLGLYRFSSPKGRHSVASTWELAGQSLESLVLADYFLGYHVPAGSGVLAEVRDILINMTPPIPPGRINFPTEDKTLSTATDFDAQQDAEGNRKLRVCNKLLNAGGFYALYTDNEGRFTTSQMQEFVNQRPQVFYAEDEGIDYGETTARGEKVTSEPLVTAEPIADEYDEENLANRVLVMSGDPETVPPLWAIAENRDPDSPISIPSLGKIIMGEIITTQNAASQIELDTIARLALAEASAYYRRVGLQTVPDPRRKPREMYRVLAHDNEGNEVVSGRWRLISWNLSESGMDHEIARVDQGRDAVWEKA